MGRIKGLVLEVMENLEDKRFQDNVKRGLDDIKRTGIQKGCLSSTMEKTGPLTWRVFHSLGVEAVGFFIVSQTSTKSIIAELGDSRTDSSLVTFAEDPGTFRLFFY